MILNDLYELGKEVPLDFSIKNVDEKLEFAQFPYRSRDIINTSIMVFIISLVLVLAVDILELSSFFSYLFLFIGILLSIICYVYPTSLYYTHKKMTYSEQMLKAIMQICNYVAMNTNLEYALINTTKSIKGTLQTEFKEITEELERREKNSLGAVIEEYTPRWNKYNPEFVRALRLIETASLSTPEDKKALLNEVQESLITTYHNMGKRLAEDLSSKAKSLVAFGVLFPVISLMLLPLVSVFLPGVVTPAVMVFIYNVLFPVTILVMALNFSSKRIQVNTISLKDSVEYKKFPDFIFVLGVIIIILFSIPAFIHLMNINTATPELVSREYEFTSILKCWLLGLGIFIATMIITHAYKKRYEKLWNQISETERDIPHLLQTFSTYLTLNVSVESIMPQIINDYKSHGFKKHPVVKFFSNLFLKLKTTKKTMKELTHKILPKICPSKKVTNIFLQIISFTDISEKSAASAAKMMRKQDIQIRKLDDYIRTLLSDTISLINITVTMLAPILAAAAILMSIAIVRSLIYIENMLQSFVGEGTKGTLQSSLVNITAIVPPTIAEVIISIYLLQMIIILGIFLSNIKNGNDKFQLVKTIHSSMFGFFVFSLILIIGYFIMDKFIFQSLFPV